MQDFAAQVNNGLENADWDTKRELITLLVKRVEVYKEEVNVVFKVPIEPQRTFRDLFSHHCTDHVSAPNLTGKAAGKEQRGQQVSRDSSPS